MSIGPNTSEGSVNRVSKYSKYSPSGILSASLNLMTRSDFAVPGGPTSSSGSCATAATHIRSISGCLLTKNRPSPVRNRLIRSRSAAASRASSSNDSSVARSIGSRAGSGSAMRSTVTESSQVAVQAAADQVLVVLDEPPAGLAEREVVGGDAEHEGLDEVEHRQAVVAVGPEVVGDAGEPAGDPGDAAERVADRRLGVGQGERAGQVEPGGDREVGVEDRVRLLEDRQRARRVPQERQPAG